MNRKKFIIQYLVSDFIGSGLAWTLFFIYRKLFIEPAKFGYKVPIDFDKNFYFAILLIPVYWVIIYWIAGTYHNIHKKSRFKEFVLTIIITFLGTIILFFFLLLDDQVKSYQVYRYTFITLLLLQFFILSVFRLSILTFIKRKIKNRTISFNTLIVGSNKKVLELYLELENEKKSQGYNFIGYVNLVDDQNHILNAYMPDLGNFNQLADIISRHDVEILILAIDSSEHYKLNNILSLVEKEDLVVKIIPDMYDLVSGTVKMNYIFGAALIEISTDYMPEWQKNVKRIQDVFISVVVLIILIPVFTAIGIWIKLNSPGPVFYWQERIGKNSRPFLILKFRTMFVDAEKNGPELSSKDDPRVTRSGKFLRKYRLDEIPQFYNVLLGQMSLVGPRPERQFYIDQIVMVAPQYKHLLRVRPGITSWGQIKFGYAENVSQMLERMKFDILYIENMTLAMDLKILFYTVLIVLKGTGK